MNTTLWIPLENLAHGRSGDKGDSFNIGLIAHQKEWLPLLENAITPEILQEWFGDSVSGEIKVWSLPGIGALNCLFRGALGGGGTTSLMLDAQGKTWGQSLLRLRVPVDKMMAEGLGIDLSTATEWQWDLSNLT